MSKKDLEEKDIEELIEEKFQERIEEKIEETVSNKFDELKEEADRDIGGTEKAKSYNADKKRENTNTSDKLSRREFLKRTGLGAAGLSALALVPSVSAFNIKSSNPLQYFNSSRDSNPNFKVDQSGDIDARNAQISKLNADRVKAYQELQLPTSNQTNNNRQIWIDKSDQVLKAQYNNETYTAVLNAIPDNGIYLDDFEDAKLSSRDSYSRAGLTPQGLEPGSSNYSSPERPEWTQRDSNGIGISQGVLELSGSTDYVMDAPLDLGGTSWDTKIRWQVTFKHNGTSNGADWYFLAMPDNTYQAQDSGNNDTWYDQGYVIMANDAGSNGISLGKDGDNNGSPGTRLIEANNVSSGTETTFEVIRYSDGTWELIQDGTSLGTATDTEYTDINYMGIAGDSRANVDVSNFLVY